MTVSGPFNRTSPLQTRLANLAPLEQPEIGMLQTAMRNRYRSAGKREILAEGELIGKPRALLSGWACRQRILSDGRRQIISFLLPGDLIGVCTRRDAVASTSIIAVTEVVTCALPDPSEDDGALTEAYSISAAIEEHCFLAQITRLGRLSAQERLVDWFLETQERLELAGLASHNQFKVPLTQEMLADTLGLTNVHVNRMLQVLRRDELLSFRGGEIELLNRGLLEALVDFKSTRTIFTPASAKPPMRSEARTANWPQ